MSEVSAQEKNAGLQLEAGPTSRSRYFSRYVALRYLRAKKSSGFVSFVTFLSIAGVALGVCTMVVSLSVMRGFERSLKERLLRNTPHLVVGTDDEYLDETVINERLLPKLHALNGIEKTSSDLAADVILKNRSKATGVQLKGVSSERLQWVFDHVIEWAGSTTAPKTPIEAQEVFKLENGMYPVFVGSELALELNVMPGDTVQMISPVENGGALGLVPQIKSYYIKGIYRTDLAEQELHEVFTTTRAVQSFLRKPKILNQVEIFLTDLGTTDAVEAQVRGILDQTASGLTLTSWKVFNRQLFYSLRLEQIAMFIALSFIVLVATFNITALLTMNVLEKRKYLSVLRAMGARPRQVSAIFIWKAIYIGALGSGLGLVSGLGICLVLKRADVIQLPDYFYDRSLPVVVDPLNLFFIVLLTFVVVVLSGIFPARRALEITPLQGVRE